MLIKAWGVIPLSLLAACTGSPTSNPGDAQESGVQHNVTARGVVQQPPDPLNTTVASPAGNTDWIEVRYEQQVPVYVQGKPDSSSYHFGRADLAFPTQSTPVELAVKGLDWHTGDSMQLVTPNIGLSIHDLDTRFAYPSAGATAIIGTRVEWSHVDAALPDATKGDVTWLAQMSTMPSSAGSFYKVITRAGAAADFTVSDGATSTLAANLAPITLDHALTVSWRGSLFGELAAQAGANARPAPAPIIRVQTLPSQLAANSNAFGRYYMYLPSLVEFGPLSATTDLVEPIAYGNPFITTGTSWTDFVTVIYPMPVRIPGVGGTTAYVVQAMPVSALATGELAPAISPVRDVRINGEAAEVARTGIGSTPTISWAAPATGEATSYAVTVRGIVNVNGGRMVKALGTFRTKGTSLTLPGFATASVDSYVLAVTATSSADRDLTTKPLVGSLPYASADYVTAQLTR